MKSKVLGLLAVSLFAGYAGSAQAVTFEFQCTTAATCGGDTGLIFRITLADSVVTDNGAYLTNTDGGAALSWWATSVSADPVVNHGGVTVVSSAFYDGFTIAGGYAQLSGMASDTRLKFVFVGGQLTGIIKEYIAGGTDGNSFTFGGVDSNLGLDGAIGWFEDRTITRRRDWTPNPIAGLTTPSSVSGLTQISVTWTRLSDVPEPGTLALLGLGLAGLGLSRRRKA